MSRSAPYSRDYLTPETAVEHRAGPEEAAVGERCLLIAPELRAGLHWAAKAGETDLAMGYLPAIAHFGWRRWFVPHGWVAEVEQFLPRTPMVAACLIGYSNRITNDFLRCRSIAAEAIALNDPSADMAYVYAMAGWAEVSLGDVEEAERLTRIGWKLGEASGEDLHKAVTRFFYAELRMSFGLDDGGVAKQLLEQGSAMNWPSVQAGGLYLLARTQTESELAKRIDLLGQSLVLSDQAGNSSVSDLARLFLLELQVTEGSLREAAEVAIEIFDQYSADGMAAPVIWAAAGVAVALGRADNYRAAATVGRFAVSQSVGFTLNRQVEEALDLSRAELGADFSEFERRGQAMAVKELIGYATTELEQLADE